ncbi:unnamed protein product [Angiostrongylus costaricensis]|uniref:Uncharacterized protein n=1 Tax=Angiostrongylus costaricensis TaxID=334426 RepID=A0A158PLW1_ANGCS|nr:unnamed protein product [Angiostrongylus costaricensis]
MCDPFSADFDPVLALQYSPDSGGEVFHGNLDDFERAFVEEQSVVARLMCELDGSLGRKSKKRMKRDRVARLEEMTVNGRKLFERSIKPSKRTTHVREANEHYLISSNTEAEMSWFGFGFASDGYPWFNKPSTIHNQSFADQMSSPYQAKDRRRVEVNNRSLNRVDHIDPGEVLVPDRHMSIVLRDVDNAALHGRGSERLLDRRKPEQDDLLVRSHLILSRRSVVESRLQSTSTPR